MNKDKLKKYKKYQIVIVDNNNKAISVNVGIDLITKALANKYEILEYTKGIFKIGYINKEGNYIYNVVSINSGNKLLKYDCDILNLNSNGTLSVVRNDSEKEIYELLKISNIKRQEVIGVKVLNACNRHVKSIKRDL